jgi:chorismate lyase/3-hydroxybenzoate synthase
MNLARGSLERAAPPTLSTSYVEASGLDEATRGGTLHPLAVVVYGKQLPVPEIPGCVAVRVDLEQFGPSPVYELWTTDQPAVRGRSGAVDFAHSHEVLFGVVHSHRREGTSIEQATRQAYGRIFELLQHDSHPHLLRIWNYFPQISCRKGALDRYQRFCIGRGEALQEYGDLPPSDLPSATAIGSASGGLVVYFLGARSPGSHFGNPRQLDPYRYPLQYGPKSPIFARATLKSWRTSQQLFISGTASIVGHASMHPGQPAEQLREAVRNIREVLRHAGQCAGRRIRRNCRLSSVKIYVRDPAHFPLVRREWQRLTEAKVPTLFLHGEVCRRDLLLEVEALATTC